MSIFAKCPFVLVPISPIAHYLPQIFIFPKSQFASSPHFCAHLLRVLFCHLSGARTPRCPFAPQMSVFSKFSLSFKYPFASVPTFHSALHFRKSPFALVPICPKCSFAASTQLSETQMSGIHLSGTQMYVPQLSGTI